MKLLCKDIIGLFVIIVAAVYCAIFVVDIFGLYENGLSNGLRFLGVAGCFIVAILAYRKAFNNQDALVLIGALLITLTADTFLLFTSWHIIGVGCFCFAHLLYIYRYRPLFFKYCFGIAVVILVVCTVIYFLQIALASSLLIAVSLLYAILIATSTFSAFTTKVLPPKNKHLAIGGMILFVLCDINVALFNIMPVESWVYVTSFMLIWVFYLPAQLLLSLSSVEYRD